jgi:ferredoxin-NADP reductase
MLDVITRALLNPIYYIGVAKVNDLTFKEKVQESEGIYSFIFTSNKLPTWKAGQHAIFTLPGKNITEKTWRPFSVASAPHEGEIRIGTILSPTPSSFKQNLLALKPGEKVRIFGPYGELYIRPKMKKVVAVSGGIGITPFRSIIADLTNRESEVSLTLIYASSNENYTYKNELDNWALINKNIHIIYVRSAEEVYKNLEEEIGKHKNSAHYFISGAPKMIAGVRESLLKNSIREKQILNDPFKGY